jgi:hypothetical protein
MSSLLHGIAANCASQVFRWTMSEMRMPVTGLSLTKPEDWGTNDEDDEDEE